MPPAVLPDTALNTAVHLPPSPSPSPLNPAGLQRLLQHKVAQHHLLQTSTAMVAGTPRVVAKRPDKQPGGAKKGGGSSSSGGSELQVGRQQIGQAAGLPALSSLCCKT